MILIFETTLMKTGEGTTGMEIRKLSEDLSVADQITPADVQSIAGLGFRTIMCNRPDFEVSDQPMFSAIEDAAIKSGLAVKFLPVSSKTVTDKDAADFATVLDNFEAPVLAYCRSGTRCTILWALSEGAKGTPVDRVVGTAARAGYDLSKLARRIAASVNR